MGVACIGDFFIETCLTEVVVLANRTVEAIAPDWLAIAGITTEILVKDIFVYVVFELEEVFHVVVV
jgi:hypothetical protein